MRALERKISKMKVLNDDAKAKLYVAEQLWKDDNISLDNAINIAKNQKSFDKFTNCHLEYLNRDAKKIAGYLNRFDKSTFNLISERKKTKSPTDNIFEDHLREIKKIIERKSPYTYLKYEYGVLQNIKELKKDSSIYNSDFYKVLRDIEKSYKTIFNLDKRIINKWYKFITSKSLITTLIVLTLISLIIFFVINTDFHREQTTTETIKITAQESVQDTKAIFRDKTLTFSEKTFLFYDLIAKTVSIIPPLLLLVTVFVWILRQIFIKNKKTSRKLSCVAEKLDELKNILKGQG